VDEVPLSPAPLALVVAQVVYPLQPRVEEDRFIAELQELLRRDYPILRREDELQVQFTHEGPKVRPQVVWRLSGPDSDWLVSASSSFVSLSTTSYTSRADFLARLGRLLEAVQQWISPPVVDRFGVRYLCRVTDEQWLAQLDTLLRPEIAGLLSADLGDGATCRQVLTEAVLDHADHATLRARWGRLPAGASLDLTVPPSSAASFVMDLDVSTMNREFAPVELHELARTFCERQYRFFRWAVTPEFLRAFGGEV
jgi:uncharacterized protein (TIGR04255 family)